MGHRVHLLEQDSMGSNAAHTRCLASSPHSLPMSNTRQQFEGSPRPQDCKPVCRTGKRQGSVGKRHIGLGPGADSSGSPRRHRPTLRQSFHCPSGLSMPPPPPPAQQHCSALSQARLCVADGSKGGTWCVKPAPCVCQQVTQTHCHCKHAPFGKWELGCSRSRSGLLLGIGRSPRANCPLRWCADTHGEPLTTIRLVAYPTHLPPRLHLKPLILSPLTACEGCRGAQGSAAGGSDTGWSGPAPVPTFKA